MIEKLKNILKLYTIKRDEVIYTCLKNNIPLTDANIKEIEEIERQKKNIKTDLKI